jgi:hypothetical protein
MAAPELTLYVIGSPSPGQKYQFQFVSAAQCRKGDQSTLWLVEKTGYEIYGVSLDYIKQAAPGSLGWITPKETLVGWLDKLNEGVIKKMVIFSHGLRGMVALRYGWDQKISPNYGLTIADIAKIDPKKFVPDPSIEFDSCNSGIGEGGDPSVAQALANRIHSAVGGWTGRTSYADINSGATCEVRGSAQSKNFLSAEFWKERDSRSHAGGAPEYKVFQPSSK